MKLRFFARFLATAIVLAWAGSGAGATTTQPGTSSLYAWARSNGFALKIRGDTITLSRASNTVSLRNSSREAAVNGISVWLLYPVSNRNGSLRISDLDLRTTLEPILGSPRLRAGSKIRTICLDPGHGGKDSGTRLGPQLEKRFALLMAQELRSQLTAAGFKVVLTRTTDTLVDLEERPALARKRGADLFLSLHCNSAGVGGTTVKGAEVYCLTPAGAASTNSREGVADSTRYPGNASDSLNMFLAYQIQRALVRDLDMEDRGVHRSRFVVLRDATMPAVLIEPGFISHPVEGKRLFETSYRRQIAKAVTRAVVAYKNAVQQGA